MTFEQWYERLRTSLINLGCELDYTPEHVLMAVAHMTWTTAFNAGVKSQQELEQSRKVMPK